jgi:hypothetical protein
MGSKQRQERARPTVTVGRLPGSPRGRLSIRSHPSPADESGESSRPLRLDALLDFSIAYERIEAAVWPFSARCELEVASVKTIAERKDYRHGAIDALR